MRNKPKSIVLTGGHAATTGLAVVEEIRKNYPNLKVYWIGVKNAVEGKNVPTLESQVFPKAGVEFYPITAGRVQRRFTFWTIPSLLKIPLGIFSSFIALLKIRPRCILSFGGFASFGVVLAGWVLRIPIVIHEQTSAAGLANKISASLADKVAIARDESRKYYPGKKVRVVGNPILSLFFEIKPPAEGPKKTILVMGGSRGSRVINQALSEVLEEAASGYRLIHITGELDFESFRKKKESLKGESGEGYSVFKWVPPERMPAFYRSADAVVSRAGANSVSEIIASRRPSVLIPIPWSFNREQQKNALFASKYVKTIILGQEGLTGRVLADSIRKVLSDADKSKPDRPHKSPDVNAARDLCLMLGEYVK